MLHTDETLFSTGRLSWWLLESVVFLLQPNPWCCGVSFAVASSYGGQIYDFYLNELLSLLSLLRCYVLVRLFLLRSAYMSPRCT